MSAPAPPPHADARPLILITGASSGIGAASARACAAGGWNLLLTARRGDALERVAAECRATGARAECVIGDVCDAGMSERLLDHADRSFGGAYAVFANAGFGFMRPTHETPDAELRRIFEVNLFAGLDLLSRAARRLLERPAPGGAAAATGAAGRRGHLLMCSSALAKFTLPAFAAYSATKAAQSHFCRAMRMELRGRRIEVSCVHPITTETEFFEPATLSSQGVTGPQARMNAPRWMVQRPEVVARAVLRCLRRPRAEVWTSPAARLLAGLVTVFPSMLDRAGRLLTQNRAD
ncbi:MAG: SDR family NAD(P)-dependent oxidoreductase [Phycisphaerales bacterium]|nr:SDR family NAD(P)-dependent oxidoreductase [Phycisphaerales bacterium]